jgi:hypothetical protein
MIAEIILELDEMTHGNNYHNQNDGIVDCHIPTEDDDRQGVIDKLKSNDRNEESLKKMPHADAHNSVPTSINRGEAATGEQLPLYKKSKTRRKKIDITSFPNIQADAFNFTSRKIGKCSWTQKLRGHCSSSSGSVSESATAKNDLAKFRHCSARLLAQKLIKSKSLHYERCRPWLPMWLRVSQVLLCGNRGVSKGYKLEGAHPGLRSNFRMLKITWKPRRHQTITTQNYNDYDVSISTAVAVFHANMNPFRNIASQQTHVTQTITPTRKAYVWSSQWEFYQPAPGDNLGNIKK